MKGRSLGRLGIGVALAASAVLFAMPSYAQDDPAPPPPDPGAAPAEGDAPAAPPAAPDGEKKPEDAAPPSNTQQPAPAPATPPPAGGTAPTAAPPPAGGTGGAQICFGASANPQIDTGAKTGGPGGGEAKEEKLPWRGTSLGWDNSATTETVGVGRNELTRNPTYEMSFIFGPRYYLWEAEDPSQSISLRGRLDLIREFTNSDSTTKRGEWTLSDLSIFPQYSRNLYKEGDIRTDLALRAPTLAFPTSKNSANSGRIIQVGALAGVTQQVPLMGTSEPVLQTFALTGRVGYSHWFTKATQPTNGDLAYTRMGPDGRALPSDQLGGAANAAHNVTLDLIGELAITEKVVWTNWFSWRPVWKYDFENRPVCGNLLTGCETPSTVQDPNNFSVITLFNSEVGVDVIDEMNVAVGYANLTLQQGPDGTRRNIFYSPDARVYATITAKLDEIYKSASGLRKSESSDKRVEEASLRRRRSAQ